MIHKLVSIQTIWIEVTDLVVSGTTLLPPVITMSLYFVILVI